MRMITLLQAAGGAAAAPQAGGAGMMWIMILAKIAIMWLFMIRPQRKQQKELEQFRSGLQKGDKVVTVGGIYGTVDEIKDTTVLIRVDGDTKLKVSKNAIQKDFSANA